MYRLVLVVAVMAAWCISSAADAQVYVRGHYRSNGTYVQPHYRSNPDGNVWNNWSTYGNTNPYTGRVGTYRPYVQRSYGYSPYTYSWSW